MAEKTYDFIVVGSGGGGATIAWMLAKAGASVLILEQGEDLFNRLQDSKQDKPELGSFNTAPHNEYQYRWRRPDFKRRPRGDYNTFRRQANESARPFKNGWTGSVVGGGGVVWGTWAFRPLPIDLRLGSHYKNTSHFDTLASQGYSVADWPVPYADFEPFFNVAEALLGVSGDRGAMTASIASSPWFHALAKKDKDFLGHGPPTQWNWLDYPCPAFSRTPVGEAVWWGLNAAKMTPCPLPSAIVSPRNAGKYSTRDAIAKVMNGWDINQRPEFWRQKADDLWSDRQRQICNMCGYCGEFICWGKEEPPKGGSEMILELKKNNVEIRAQAKAFEVIHDEKKKRVTGVRYLDLSNPDKPVTKDVLVSTDGKVILSCGAVQSARLLFMSGPSRGLGNHSGHLGRHATFHLFGLSAKAVFKKNFSGLLHGNLGHTGNVTSFSPYFLRNAAVKEDHPNAWLKAGTLTSTAKKNPLENALEKVEEGHGDALLKKMDEYSRTVEMRLTGDDLPMARNRVDLDPNYVDEYGIPVARITRDFGENELQMFEVAKAEMKRAFDPLAGALESPARASNALVDLIGDHQMGTCRMGFRPEDSVLDADCRVWETHNLYVVDSSFMPTGFGLNPMVTVVANALRVGSKLVAEFKNGGVTHPEVATVSRRRRSS